MNDAPTDLIQHIARQWDDELVPRLIDYIRVPAKSPHFDADWERHGHIERVVTNAERWVKAQGVAGLSVEIVRIEGSSDTPVPWGETVRPRVGAIGWHVVRVGRKR